MNIVATLAKELSVKETQVKAAVELIDAGNTIPFIARYRKEATGALDDTQLRALNDRLTYLRSLAQRKEEVLSTIEAQEKLTEPLRCALEKAITLAEVEDIYRPFRPKRKTRASTAREQGLEPLAQALLLSCSRLPSSTLSRKRAWKQWSRPCRGLWILLPRKLPTTPPSAGNCGVCCGKGLLFPLPLGKHPTPYTKCTRNTGRLSTKLPPTGCWPWTGASGKAP